MLVKGRYANRTQLLRALESDTTDSDVLSRADDNLEAASRWIERTFRTTFFPVTDTHQYRWPQRTGTGWTLHLGQWLLSVSTLTTEGDTATAIAASDYFLEPQTFGPPYDRIEIDLESSAFFASGATPQRSIRVAGKWGFSDETADSTTLNDPSGISASDTTVVLTSGSAFGVGDVMRVESEDMLVTAVSTNTLTVERGINGTTAATHADSTAASRVVAPSDVRELCIARAASMWAANSSRWTGVFGGSEMAIESRLTALNALEAGIRRRTQFLRFAVV